MQSGRRLESEVAFDLRNYRWLRTYAARPLQCRQRVPQDRLAADAQAAKRKSELRRRSFEAAVD